MVSFETATTRSPSSENDSGPAVRTGQAAVRSLLTLVLLASLAGCGLKGDLYLPDDLANDSGEAERTLSLPDEEDSEA